MHDLLRDMGREIIRNKSTEGGKEPSRLWRYEDVHYVLSKDTVRSFYVNFALYRCLCFVVVSLLIVYSCHHKDRVYRHFSP